MNAPLQPSMLKLIDAMSALLVEDYLRAEPSRQQAPPAACTDPVPFPVVDRAA